MANDVNPIYNGDWKSALGDQFKCVQPAFQVGFRGSKRPPKMALEFVDFLELGLGVYNWSKLMVFLGVPTVDGFLPTIFFLVGFFLSIHPFTSIRRHQFDPNYIQER